ncbi:L-lysine 6-transaminase [candidate division KSB1 bacterium]|nr:L-lysine 6-transaminase [candidate division KSB1 bacterium]NIR69962.1 L-lysine 6-transaminase [candidate division KSB1 bacterium]NIS25861.1 L-lysine 6-transaminase [candidate division KSB1 bacterium]NIT72738.1 L-lysine 6-transaminase [candidate division KSB1 bacterium]NIU26550.1 L-lysine 6-transaminase [candidate division KSB1 bacterium]
MLKLEPNQVFPILKKHMLVDGFDDMVIDLQKSQGCYIYDSLNKRQLLDLFGFFATTPVGHNHPAMHTQEFKDKILSVAIMKPSNSDFYSAEMAEFVESFSKHAIPEHMPHLFMVSGGALAVENALKAAFDWKIRKNFQKGQKEEKGTQVIHFKEAFHGRTGYTLSMTNTADARKTKYFPKFNWPRITNPKIAFPLNEANLRNVEALEEQAIQEIQEAIDNNPDDIAAIIIEPIQGEGGDNHFRRKVFQSLRQIADEHDILLIFDEVQTGVGLTGEMWCFQHFGVKPDLMAFGKKTQVCGFLCSRRIEEVENHVFQEASRINSTWGGNLVDMVRFRKYLEIIITENLIENAKKVGQYFLGELQSFEKEFEGQVSNVRGRGLMIAFDLPTGTRRTEFLNAAFRKGMIALGCGQRSVRFRPALNLTESIVDDALEIIRTSLREILDVEEGRVGVSEADEAKYEL